MTRIIYPCPDACIIVAGAARRDRSDFTLARYTCDGQLDPEFGTGGSGFVTTQEKGAGDIKDLVVQRDGKIIAVGHVATENWPSMIAAYRFHRGGGIAWHRPQRVHSHGQ